MEHTRRTALERAYELARSGTCVGLDDLIRRLEEEGYPTPRSTLTGPVLRRDLTDLCREARRAEPWRSR